jgi:hypothetical protein
VLKTMVNPNQLNLLNVSLKKIRGDGTARLSNPQYIKEIRGQLAKITEMDNFYRDVFSVHPIALADNLLVEHLKKETIETVNELDTLICQASFEATFNLQIPLQLYSRLISKINYIESIIANLQKYATSGE